MNKSFLYVANWKMQKTYQETQFFVEQFGPALIKLESAISGQIVIAPSFVALPLFTFLIKNSSISLCAQDCSAYDKGPYTGQVDAPSLAQVDCSYCIVGHSEQREQCNETDEVIARKVKQLLLVGICPIICVGETEAEWQQHITKQVLEKQLAPIFDVLADHAPSVTICIAYEPRFAIGTGVLPSKEHIIEIFKWLAVRITALPQHSVQLLYGGSVHQSNIQLLSSIESIDGFLMGSASLDFQNFENIISLSQARLISRKS